MATVAKNNNNDFAEDFDDDNGGSLSEQLDLQHYLRILRKHKWPITLFTAAVTVLAAYYAFTATPIYSSTSTLLIEQQKTNVPNIEDLFGLDTQSSDYYQTQFELLKSRSLAERVIGHVGLWNNPELSPAAREAQARVDAAKRSALGDSDMPGVKVFFTNLLSQARLSTDATAGADGAGNTVVEPIDVEVSSLETSAPTGVMDTNDVFFDGQRSQVVANFMQRVSITPVRKTKLVKISYESADPVLAARVANAIGEQYIQAYLENKLERTAVADSVMDGKLETLKASLEESEQRLIEYKEANGLVDVGGSVNRLWEQELLLLTTELAQARSELSAAADIYRDVQSLRGTPELLQSVPGVQADPLVQRTKIEEGQAQRALDELLNRYGERHPRVVDAKSQLTTLNNTLQNHVLRVANSIEKQYQLKRQKVASIERELAAGKQTITDTGSKQFVLEDLEREVATKQGIYDKFFNSRSEADSADGLETANAIISDQAITPITPIKPKKQLIIALAALASLVLSMLMAFLYEQMDDTIKSTNDIEGKLGMKLLGILPLVKNGVFNRSRELPLNPADIPDKKGTFSEAVNTVRTALCMDDGESGRKVIMVTSSVPGEGKSTASINIAYSLAQLERVLLIDCDMRRPTVAKAAGLDKNVSGLSNLITNSAPAKECIKRGAFDGAMDILPSGPIPDQPLELLSSKRFEKIVEQLGDHYDRIVIDSAPTQAVSDALVLSKLCDAVVYAVKSHDTSIELVKRGLQRLKQVNARVAGVLITQVDIDRITSYGGDYYYQGYYDYYGYTEKGEKLKRPGKLRLSQEELISIKNDDSDVNLDLDYGLESTPKSKMNGSVLNAKVNGKSSNGVVKDVKRAAGKSAAALSVSNANATVEENAEFDLTAQMDMPVMPTDRSRKSSKNADKNKKRFKDDLDII